MTTITKTEKVLNALMSGTELTAKQITSRYGVKNVRAVMSKLRTEGYPIFLNKRVSSFDGQTYNKYRLGTASRRIISAGYKAMALGVDA